MRVHHKLPELPKTTCGARPSGRIVTTADRAKVNCPICLSELGVAPAVPEAPKPKVRTGRSWPV